MTTNTDRIDLTLIDQLLKDYQSPEDILGENGILKQFTKAILERAMAAELTTHLGYEKHDPAGKNSGNSRNGKSQKTLTGDFGALPIEVPRDRDSSFEPRIVPKGQTRFEGFDEKILSLYARGMSTREIQRHLEEIYQVEVSPTLISNVTEAIMEEVTAWQTRPLDAEPVREHTTVRHHHGGGDAGPSDPVRRATFVLENCSEEFSSRSRRDGVGLRGR